MPVESKQESLSACFFSHSALLDGAERSLLELVTELTGDHGVLCTVVLPYDGPLRKKLEEAGAATVVIDYSWWCDHAVLPENKVESLLSHSIEDLLYDVKQVLSKINPDVIVTNTMVIPWGAIAASFMGKPHIWFVREYGASDHNLKFFLPFNTTLEVIDHLSAVILTNSEAVGKAHFGGISRQKVFTVYPYIKIPEDALNQAVEHYYNRANSIKLILIGAMQEGKGHRDAILAAAELVHKGKDIELVFMGRINTDYMDNLNNIIRDEGLEENVRFMDYRDNPFPVMNQADIVLVCSRQEAFGRVTAEAMLMKKPVIGTNTGGTPELIRDGYNGLIYEPGDYKSLAEKIEYLAGHPDEAGRLAENGLEFAGRTFTRDGYGGKVYRLLRSLKGSVDKGKRPAGLSLKGPGMLDALLAAAATRDTRIAALITELGSSLADEKKLATGLEANLQEKSAWIDELVMNLQEKSSHIDELIMSVQEKSSHIDELTMSVQEKSSHIDELIMSVQEKSSHIDELIMSVHDKSSHIDELEISVQEKSSRIEQLEAGQMDDAARIRIMESHIEGLNRSISSKDALIQQIMSGMVMRLMTKYKIAVDRVLRPGSKLRRIYDLGLTGTRLIVNRGFGTFFREFGNWIRNISQVNKAAPQAKAGLIEFDEAIPASEAKAIAFPRLTGDPEISIIIPVYNKWNYTLNCLKSIRRNTEGNYEVIVVDDASSDGTARILSKVKNLTVIRNKQNTGFVESCNAGSGISRGKYLLFLNNDTVVTKNWLTPLLELIRRAKVGAVGPKLVYPDGRLQAAGIIVWKDGLTWPYGHGDSPDMPEYNYVREVDCCTGACLIVEKALFQQVGGYDRLFQPGFYDDPDLCFALRGLGYKIMYQPMSLVYHFEAVTFGREVAEGISNANRAKFVDKWKKTLDQSHFPSETNDCLNARDRGREKRVLVIDDRVPLYDQGSGYPRAYNMLTALAELNYGVTFFPIGDSFQYQPYSNDLQLSGVEVIYGMGPDFKEFAKARQNYYDAVIVSRPHNMEKSLYTIKEFLNKAVLIYDAEAIYILRDILKARAQGSFVSEQEADNMMAKEFDLMRMADTVVTVSSREKAIIMEKAGLKNVTVWGHPIDAKEQNASLAGRKDILFVGGFPFAGSPNEDAILYFVREIFPQLHEKLSCKLYIVGHNPPDSVRKLSSSSIVVTGYVQDLRPYYDKCRIFIVPHQYSAGIPWKLQEAMSYGIPSVISELTGWQLNLSDGNEALVASDAQDFIQKITHLYQDEDLWLRIQQNELDYIKQECDPEALKRSLKEIIQSTLKVHKEQRVDLTDVR